MMFILLIAVAATFGGICVYKCAKSEIVANIYDLYDFVGTQYTGFKRVTVTMQMIRKILYMDFIQYLNNTVHRINDDDYEIEYMIENRVYRKKVTVNRHPSNILMAVDIGTQKEITNTLNMYAGPEKNYSDLTPEIIGINNNVLIMYSDGNDKVFDYNEKFS